MSPVWIGCLFHRSARAVISAMVWQEVTSDRAGFVGNGHASIYLLFIESTHDSVVAFVRIACESF